MDLTILFEPGETARRRQVSSLKLSPALIGDYVVAKAGPITGVPPGDSPKG
jgi:hypothetical protein